MTPEGSIRSKIHAITCRTLGRISNVVEPMQVKFEVANAFIALAAVGADELRTNN